MAFPGHAQECHFALTLNVTRAVRGAKRGVEQLAFKVTFWVRGGLIVRSPFSGGAASRGAVALGTAETGDDVWKAAFMRTRGCRGAGRGREACFLGGNPSREACSGETPLGVLRVPRGGGLRIRISPPGDENNSLRPQSWQKTANRSPARASRENQAPSCVCVAREAVVRRLASA